MEIPIYNFERQELKLLFSIIDNIGYPYTVVDDNLEIDIDIKTYDLIMKEFYESH